MTKQIALDGEQKQRFKRLRNQKLTKARCANCNRLTALMPDRWICRRCFNKFPKNQYIKVDRSLVEYG